MSVHAHEAGGDTFFAGVWSRDEEVKGTKAQLCRWQSAGSSYTAAVVFNKYVPDVFDDLDDLLCDAVEAVPSWPNAGNWNDVL